ncbi:hypothetical protein M4D79_02705 [Mycolicibacterium novocastrense]|nr:hypothetical protein M4D79_02705 [Mycolicibacterium novocastrense]
MAIVTLSVMTHSVVETFTEPPVVKTPEVSSTATIVRVGPQHRSSDDGRRDDDTAAKEYSPPQAILPGTGE